MAELFRQEVLEKNKVSHLGNIVLYSPPSFWIITLLILLIIAAIIGFIVFGEYARKERVFGILMPSKGLVQIAPSQPGIFDEVYVAAGESIEVNSPLFKIKDEKIFDGGTNLNQRLLSQMKIEMVGLRKIEANIDDKYQFTKNRLLTQKQELLGEIERYEEQIDVQLRVVDLEKETYTKLKKLSSQKLTDELQVNAAQKSHLEKLQDLNALINTKEKILSNIKDLDAQISLLPVQRLSEEGEIERRIHELDQEITRVGASGNALIRAPISGKVAAVTARKGQQASPVKTAVSILPSGGRLQAQLYVPTRAIAFLSEGQTVRLRYDAFPYQKFGIHKGTLTEISRTVLSSSDLTIAPRTEEPFFLATVDIEEQTIFAFEDDIPLQAGMSLSADIILEERKLWEWLFEPLIGVMQ